MCSSESILKIENSKVPTGDTYPQTLLDGRRSAQQSAKPGRYVACVKNKDIPRHYVPIATMATRCCHCSLNYLEFWHSPDAVLNLEGLKS